ncbi:MAG: beta-ketoacyl-ACP synthase III, partial [Prochlorotrichaceae cyanobacterium]
LKLGLSSGWIEKNSGVLTRYFVENETASEMGAFAAKDALKQAGLSIEDIDCLICTNGIPEQAIPCTASLVQEKLGAGNSGIPAFDISSTCLSFVTGLDTISYLIEAGRYNRVLIVATEIMTGLNWDDKETCTLFGDGAAAVVIAKTEDGSSSKILCSRMETYGRGSRLTECPGAGNKLHPKYYAENPEAFLFRMDGPGIYRIAIEILPRFVERLLKSADLNISDLDMVVPHQASKMAMHLVRKKLKVPEEKWMNIIHNHGNAIAASIPMALHEAIKQEKIHRGDRIMLLGTSAGFSVGAIILDY